MSDVTLIAVPAGREAWTPTGVVMADGDTLDLKAEGTVQYWKDGRAFTPDGDADRIADEDHFVPGQRDGALVGRLGGGEPFLVGSHLRLSSGSGALELVLNDRRGTYGDNDGALQVQVVRAMADEAPTGALANAKLRWKDGAGYDQLGIDDSTMIGVEADGNVFVVQPGQGVSTASVVGGVIVTRTAEGPQYKLVGSAAVMRVQDEGAIGGIDTVDVAILEAHAEAELSPMYAGAGAGFNLAGGSASIFDFNLGAGVSTGAGIKDESIELKFAGTGVTVGRKISISVLDTSFGIDLVRTAQAVYYVGTELEVAVATVPGAMADAGVALVDQFQQMPGTFAQAGKDLGSEVAKMPGEFAQAGKDLGGEVAKMPGAFAQAGKDLGGQLAEIPGAFAEIPGAFADAGRSLKHLFWD